MIELTLIQKITVWALPILFAISMHEVAHGWVAYLLGDKTARFMGRLTLNPLPHIDIIGTILIPLLLLSVSNFIFGWAKPVPVDPRNFHHPRRDMALVALAGPFSNLGMACLWALIAKLGFFALLHDNSWVGTPLIFMGKAGIIINIVLGVLNLLPLPSLDGSKILLSLLPPRLSYRLGNLEYYSFFILIIFIMTGLLSAILNPPVTFLIHLIETLFGL